MKLLTLGLSKAIPFLHSSITPPAIVQAQRKEHVRPNRATGRKRKTDPKLKRQSRVNDMAVLDLNQGAAQRGEGRFGNLFADLRDYLARRALFRQTVRELNDLSGRELADLGINRSMIRSVAYEAAWGSK